MLSSIVQHVYDEEGHQGLLMVQEAELHSINSLSTEHVFFLLMNNFYYLLIEIGKLVQC